MMIDIEDGGDDDDGDDDSLQVKGPTEVHILCEIPVQDRTLLLKYEGLDVTKLRRLSLIHHYGNTATRRHLARLPIDSFTSVMIVADEIREADALANDSHALATLLLLRDLQNLHRSR